MQVERGHPAISRAAQRHRECFVAPDIGIV
jgi:hypothetical protein